MFPASDELDIEIVGANLASYPRRVAGLLLDQVLVLLPVFAAAMVFGYQPGDAITDDALLVFNAAAAATAFVYETLMIGLLGRTVGKLATGTRVVRAIDSGRVLWSAALLRALVPVAFGAVPQVGFALGLVVYVWAFFNPLRQGLHDKAGGTIVVLNSPPTD